ncbi:unnamed protein product [Boreogadus saida]
MNPVLVWRVGMDHKEVLSLLLLAAVWLPPCSGTPERDGGGWAAGSEVELQDEGPCSIDVLDAASLTHRQFLERYAYTRPVILTGITDNTHRTIGNAAATNTSSGYCVPRPISWGFVGDRSIRLSTANTHSYKKVDVPFREYVDVLLKPQSADALGSVLRRQQLHGVEGPLFRTSTSTPAYGLPGTTAAYSCGVAGPGSGVPFHWHGPGFSEVLYGRKRWFLYPPDREPHFHPNRTTLSWLQETYPVLPPEEAPLECTIRPRGAVLPRPLVARHPQPGHQCLHVHVPGTFHQSRTLPSVGSAAGLTDKDKPLGTKVI